MTPSPVSGPTIVAIGEALFDCFPDREQLGGAPCNFAIHANQLLKPVEGRGVIVTRVGSDDRAERLVDALKTHSITMRYVQQDAELPTGTVRVELGNSGSASYYFDARCAWDAIVLDEDLIELAKTADAVCFGTLAQRHTESASAIHSFLSHAQNAIIVFDANLRQSFYNAETLTESLCVADIAKLNEEELPIVAGLMLGDNESLQAPADMANALITRFGLRYLVLTKGAEGTSVFGEHDHFHIPPITLDRTPDADTVGAGDACGAAIISAIVTGRSMREATELGNRAGSYVASRSGATPKFSADFANSLSSNPSSNG